MLNAFVLKIKRKESPFYGLLYDLANRVRKSNLPVPSFLNPVLGILFSMHMALMATVRWIATYFYREPLFRGRCESIGKRFSLSKMPFVIGHTRIYIGDDVTFFGKVDIFSGRVYDDPKIIIRNHVNLGHNVSFIINKEVVVEDHVRISSGVTIMDTDSHPRDPQARDADLPPPLDEIRPVRICKSVWIGHGSSVLKGVTIGEGAIIGAHSVVVTDIPPFSVAMGNPARVVMKNVGGSSPPRN